MPTEAYALCPMPYALCPMPDSTSSFARKAIYLECLSKGVMQNYNLTSQGAETLGGQTTGD